MMRTQAETDISRLTIPRLLAKLMMPDFCVSCGTLLDLSSDPAAVFCDDCLKTWLSLSRGACPGCGLPVEECVCKVSAKGRKAVDRYTYLVPYDEPITKAVAYTLKRERIIALEHFVARELAKRVLRVAGKDRKDVLLTYPPRSSKAKVEYGYDQMQNVTEKVAKLTGIPMKSLFKNCKGREQKSLKRAERMENADKTYRFCGDGEDVKGKRVILLDDVVTSGSTTVACGKLLRAAGAATVICVSIFRKM